MSIAEQIAQIASALPADRQREVLDFAEFLKTRERVGGDAPRPRVLGAFAGRPYRMADDFDEPLPDEFWTGEEHEAAR